MTLIKNHDRIEPEILKVYEDIDGIKVIEEFLMFKGTEEYKRDGNISLPQLEQMALVAYGLKSNSTNKLHVGWHLEKFFKRQGMLCGQSKLVNIPANIWDKCEALHQQFRHRSSDN